MNQIDIDMIDTLERFDFIKDQNEMVDLQLGEYIKYSDLKKMCEFNK